MCERDDYADLGSHGPGAATVALAIGRAILFALACGVLCLVVIELVLGYNMYFASHDVWLAACYAPAILGGVMHFGYSARRLYRTPAAPTTAEATE